MASWSCIFSVGTGMEMAVKPKSIYITLCDNPENRTEVIRHKVFVQKEFRSLISCVYVVQSSHILININHINRLNKMNSLCIK